MAAAFGNLHPLPQLESVVIGDDDLGAVDIIQHVIGNQLAARIVAVRVVRLENAKPVLDGQPRCHDQKSACEVAAAWTANGIDRLPCDDHGHDRRFASPRRQFEGETQDLGIGIPVDALQMLQNPFARFGKRSDLHQPDGCLDCLDLAKKWTHTAERVMPPMVKKPLRLGRHLPLAGVRKTPPNVHMGPHLVDNRGRIILLGGRGNPLPLIKNHLFLIRRTLALFRFGNRRDELRATAGVQNLLGRLSGGIQLPVPLRAPVWRIQNRVIKKWIRHQRCSECRKFFDNRGLKRQNSFSLS